MELKDSLAIDLTIRACLLYDSQLNLHIYYHYTTILDEYLLLSDSSEKQNDQNVLND